MNKKLAEMIASEFHEDWRKTRLKEDGTFEPRWKAVKDDAFTAKFAEVEKLPTYLRRTEAGLEIDIANASYNQLSANWQEENKAAAEVVATIITSGEELTEEQIGYIIHLKWLERNDWAKGGELDVPFSELPKNEQEKDLSQYRIGMAVYTEYTKQQKKDGGIAD